jgi:hypothetical protein
VRKVQKVKVMAGLVGIAVQDLGAVARRKNLVRVLMSVANVLGNNI